VVSDSHGMDGVQFVNSGANPKDRRATAVHDALAE
jgi:hypothetical protein